MDVYDDVLKFVGEYIEEHGYGPSYKEIMEACEISSTSMVARYVDQLVDEGALQRAPGIARSIRLSGE